ncbi:CHAT domain-containing protein [Aphanizomenon sp. PH219]|nr:CHAT domain-containing protein [Aphanizomenon sp. 202]MDK2461577.1 CHAT domain-containing protein [Aphanizomenon sp. PH219]
MKLENCRLVTLSACETGITDFTSTSDEYIGLPSGFLLAGSTNVVSSLWKVHDQATALLMVKFYEELQHENNLVLALRNAQIWLRDTNILGFKQWLPDSSLDADWKEDLKEYFSKEEQEQGSNVQIFASPFYWSAFCAIGKGVETMSAYQRTIQAFVKLIESESSLFSREDWDDLDKLASNLPEDSEEISSEIRNWLELESRSQIKQAFDKKRQEIPSELNKSETTLGPGGAKSPTQTNQPSESSKELIGNAIKLNSPLSDDKKSLPKP